MDQGASVVSCITDPPALVVMKFGGSSVATADRIEQVVTIVEEKAQTTQPVVVVSALGSVTDWLSKALENPLTTDIDRLTQRLRSKHETVAEQLLTPDLYAEYQQVLEKRLQTLQDVWTQAGGAALSPAGYDQVLSLGERLSAPLLAYALSSRDCWAKPFNAAQLIRTVRTKEKVSVHLEATRLAVKRWYGRLDAGVVPIVPGFIGGTLADEVTTLGRGGSDYSAALLARTLKAPVLERWTDVDGLYTADPRKYKDSKRLTRLSHLEAIEQTKQGGFGMHPRTLDPLLGTNVTVHVRGTPTPDQPGTVITPVREGAELV